MQDKKNEPKEYSLKPAESNLLIYVRNHLDAIFSGVLSTMAMDRLAYKVTDKTKFHLSNDFTTVTINEVEDEQPTGADDSPIKTAKEKVQGEADPTAKKDI